MDQELRVKDGQLVEAGDPVTEGSINPHDIVKIKGIGGVQDYMVKEVQRVYRLQGVDINDKHIEVIVRQMLIKLKLKIQEIQIYYQVVMIDVLDIRRM